MAKESKPRPMSEARSSAHRQVVSDAGQDADEQLFRVAGIPRRTLSTLSEDEMKWAIEKLKAMMSEAAPGIIAEARGKAPKRNPNNV